MSGGIGFTFDATGSPTNVQGELRRELELPCGRCIGCRLTRSRNWAIRLMHERQMHERSIFATFTFDDANYKPSLDYRDFQLFNKKLRKRMKPHKLRFFCVGEYGDQFKRPHYHAILFGLWPHDGKYVGKGLFESRELSRIWSNGEVKYGDVTFQSAAYCAKYATEKITGPMAVDHYKRVHIQTAEIVDVVPEFAHMSLRPAIGLTWFKKYFKEVYVARDGVVVGGRTLPAPKYYDKLLMDTCPELKEEKDYLRYTNSLQFAMDCTPERLKSREQVAWAKLKFDRGLKGK